MPISNPIAGNNGLTQVLLWGGLLYTATVGTWTYTEASGWTHEQKGQVQSNDLNGAKITFPCYLQAGTYTVKCLYYTGSNRAKFDVAASGVAIKSGVDAYAAAPGESSFTETGIVLTASTSELTVTNNGKNAASSGYITTFYYILITRTS